jgi:hypothetical protein
VKVVVLPAIKLVYRSLEVVQLQKGKPQKQKLLRRLIPLMKSNF